MKKTFFLVVLCVFSVAILHAQIQTIVSSTAEISSCFNNTGDTTVSLKCGYDYTWVHPTDPSLNISCDHSGDYQRTLTNHRGCDSVVTLHLTIPNTECAPDGVPSTKTIFSVGDGKYVYFSKGNLQYVSTGSRQINQKDGSGNYQIKNGTFSFVNHQWEGGYLFGYGTSGKLCSGYDEPTRQSEDYSQYPTQNISKTDYDWGQYNAISNGGEKPNIWRTLTNDEWGYLLGTNQQRANKWGWGKITDNDNKNPRFGLILLPDQWTCPTQCTDWTSGINANNVYTEAVWELMEDEGAIFLPAVGERQGSTKRYNNQYCMYWSSTYNPNGNSSAFYVFAGDKDGTRNFNAQNSNSVYLGRSVRLVQDIKSE